MTRRNFSVGMWVSRLNWPKQGQQLMYIVYFSPVFWLKERRNEKFGQFCKLFMEIVHRHRQKGWNMDFLYDYMNKNRKKVAKNTFTVTTLRICCLLGCNLFNFVDESLYSVQDRKDYVIFLYYKNFLLFHCVGIFIFPELVCC